MRTRWQVPVMAIGVMLVAAACGSSGGSSSGGGGGSSSGAQAQPPTATMKPQTSIGQGEAS